MTEFGSTQTHGFFITATPPYYHSHERELTGKWKLVTFQDCFKNVKIHDFNI